jgi:hypothetical protein
LLSYYEKPGKDDLTIQKSNRIPEDQVTIICQEIGITHDEFDEAFKNNSSEKDYELLIDNMVVGIGDAYLEHCEGRFGISMPLVRETIRNPDSRRDLSTSGSSEYYFVTKIPESRDYLLVQVSRSKFQHIKITFVFRIIEELAKEAQSIEPNDLLQVLADRTGIPLEIGSVRKNFYWNEEIRIDEHERLFAFGEQPPEKFYSLVLFNCRRENGQLVNNVHVAYMIDLDEYQRLLE